MVSDHIINDDLDQPGRKEFHGGGDRRSAERERGEPPVRPDVPENAKQGFQMTSTESVRQYWSNSSIWVRVDKSVIRSRKSFPWR